MGAPWSRQKEIDWDTLMASQDDIRRTILGVKEPRDRFILGLLYLTGARVSEITGIKANNIRRETINGKPSIVFFLVNRKNKRQHSKILALPISNEPQVCHAVLGFIDRSPPGAALTPGTRQRIWQIVIKYMGWNPHVFRHLCLSFMIKYHKFRDIDLKNWAGWTDMRPATDYIKYRYRDYPFFTFDQDTAQSSQPAGHNEKKETTP